MAVTFPNHLHESNLVAAPLDLYSIDPSQLLHLLSLTVSNIIKLLKVAVSNVTIHSGFLPDHFVIILLKPYLNLIKSLAKN